MPSLEDIIFYCACFLVGAMIILLLVFRFANPELTETQLLIKCWVQYALVLIGTLSGMWASYKREKEK